MTESILFGNIKVVSEIKYGSAARANRGRYTGSKIHRLSVERVVGVVEGADISPRSFAAEWLREQKKPEGLRRPVYVSVYPCCGVTQGQHAGAPVEGYGPERVTCSHCKG